MSNQVSVEFATGCIKQVKQTIFLIYVWVFQAEVIFLGQLSHPNLVKLVGYCCENEHRMLIYEFMPGGSVESHLFSSKKLFLYFCKHMLCVWFKIIQKTYYQLIIFHFFAFAIVGVLLPLPWSTRMKIALGAAKGLAFLHEAEKPVIYRDFKTSNILLDEVSIGLFC